jgi:RNAse (barnase) inhibitor barstar
MDGFHSVFAKKLGFPDFYGRNMDAWIDCMTSLDAPEDGLSGVHVQDGMVLTLQISNYKTLKEKARDVCDALIECSAFVNWRRIERGRSSVVALSFYE